MKNFWGVGCAIFATFLYSNLAYSEKLMGELARADLPQVDFVSAEIVPDTQNILLGDARGSIWIWDWKNKNSPSELPCPGFAFCQLREVKLSHDGGIAISAHADGGAIWDLKQQKLVRKFSTQESLRSVAVWKKSVFFGTTDGRIIEFDFNTGQRIADLNLNLVSVLDLEINPVRETLFVLDRQGKIVEWSLSNRKIDRVISPSRKGAPAYYHLQVSERNGLLYAVQEVSTPGNNGSHRPKSLHIWDLKTGIWVGESNGNEILRSFSITEDGTHFIGSLGDPGARDSGGLIFGELSSSTQLTRKITFRHEYESSPSRAISISDDLSFAASAERDGKVFIWDLNTALKEPKSYRSFRWGGEINILAVSSIGHALVGGSQRALGLSDIQSEKVIGEHNIRNDQYDTHPYVVLEFSPLGTRYVCKTQNGNLKLVDQATGKALAEKIYSSGRTSFQFVSESKGIVRLEESDQDTFFVVDIPSFKTSKDIEVNSRIIDWAVFSENEILLLKKNSLEWFNLNTEKVGKSLPVQNFSDIRLSADRSKAVFKSKNQITVMDLLNGKSIFKVTGVFDHFFFFDQDRKLAFIRGASRKIRIWDFHLNQFGELFVPNDVIDLQPHPNGKSIHALGENQFIYSWSVDEIF